MSERRLRWLLAVVVAAIAGGQLQFLLLWDAGELARHAIVRDDAFFYAVIARNFHDVGFLTFDGEMPTNGVQPLWMAALIAATALFPGADEVATLSRMSWICYVGFAFLAAWWAARGERWTAAAGVAVLSALVVLNPWFQFLAIRGQEVPLVLVVLMAWLLALDREPRSAAGIAGLATLGVLCFFGRTDLFWLSAATFGWLLLRRPDDRRNWLVYGGVTAALVLPYLAYNKIVHGGLMPISGRVKRFYLDAVYPTWGDYLASQEWRGLFEAFETTFHHAVGSSVVRYGVPLGLAVLLIVAVRDLRRPAQARRLPAGLHVLAPAMVAHVLFMYLWYRELRPYSAYYFVGEVLLFGLMLVSFVPEPFGLEPRPKRRYGLAAVVAVSALLVVVWTIGRYRELEPADYWSTHLAMVEELNRLPEDVTVGAYWPGALAALSNKRVIPLDGIVGSQQFFEERVKRGRDLDYLLERPRPHLAIYLHRTPEELLAYESFPELRFWNRTGELQLWRHRDCDPQVLARHPLLDDGTGWYLLRFPEDCPPVPGSGYE